jgi:hypothetical protein
MHFNQTQYFLIKGFILQNMHHSHLLHFVNVLQAKEIRSTGSNKFNKCLFDDTS